MRRLQATPAPRCLKLEATGEVPVPPAVSVANTEVVPEASIAAAAGVAEPSTAVVATAEEPSTAAGFVLAAAASY